jgi:hypothetical protein
MRAGQRVSPQRYVYVYVYVYVGRGVLGEALCEACVWERECENGERNDEKRDDERLYGDLLRGEERRIARFARAF